MVLQRKLGASYTAHSQAKSFPLINLHGALPHTEEGHHQPVFGKAAAPWFCTRLRCQQRAPAAPLPRHHAAPRSPAEQRCLAPGGAGKAAVSLKIHTRGKLPPTAPLWKATLHTNSISTVSVALNYDPRCLPELLIARD